MKDNTKIKNNAKTPNEAIYKNMSETNNKAEAKTKTSTIKWISEVSGGRKLYIAILILVQMVLGISSVFYAVILRDIINKAVSKNQQGFYICMAAFAGLVVFQLMLRAVVRFLEEYTRATIENQFKKRLLFNILIQDYETISSVHSGEWMNRLTSDTVVVADGMAQIVPGVAGMLVKMLGALTMILILIPEFGFILIPGGALLIILTYVFRKVLKSLHKRMQEADGNLRIFLQESISSMLVVRVFGKERQTLGTAEDKMIIHRKARMKKNHFSNICNVGFGGIIQGAYVLGTGICGYGILKGTMTYGTLMAIMQLISQIQSPFANITGYLPKYYAMIASAERIREIELYSTVLCDAEANDDRNHNSVVNAFESNNSEIIINGIKSLDEINELYKKEFRGIGLLNCSFTYKPPVKDAKESMPVVLSNVNVNIDKGDYIAFTGPSGCGKSTVFKLLMCVYSIKSGRRYIRLNTGEYYGSGEKFCDTELTSDYRRLFAYVPQGNNLMTGTIREIVAFSNSERMKDDDKIWNSLHIACADIFVREMNMGLDTMLGERGLGLSEGQMQRIAIARAIFSDNPILMLDESTSALDENTEKQLLENLKNLTDKTVLVVTHRAAVLKICNKEVKFSANSVITNNLN